MISSCDKDFSRHDINKKIAIVKVIFKLIFIQSPTIIDNSSKTVLVSILKTTWRSRPLIYSVQRNSPYQPKMKIISGHLTDTEERAVSSEESMFIPLSKIRWSSLQMSIYWSNLWTFTSTSCTHAIWKCCKLSESSMDNSPGLLSSYLS